MEILSLVCLCVTELELETKTSHNNKLLCSMASSPDCLPFIFKENNLQTSKFFRFNDVYGAAWSGCGDWRVLVGKLSTFQFELETNSTKL